MLKQLYIMTFEIGHVAFASTLSHFSVILFPMLGKQTLHFINVVSIHLTLVGELNRQRSSFNLHSFCFFITISSSSKNKPSIIQKWLVLPLPVLTPHRLTPFPLPVIPTIPSMHHHQARKWLLPPPSFLSQSFPFPLKSSFLKKFNPRGEWRGQRRGLQGTSIEGWGGCWGWAHNTLMRALPRRKRRRRAS